jgi:hypothetical protein
MIQEYVSGLAGERGIKLSGVSVIDGTPLGCRNMWILKMSSNFHLVSTLIDQSDLEKLQKGLDCDRLELKVWVAMSRLQILAEAQSINSTEIQPAYHPQHVG